ncbi:hypothetical protein TNCV_2839941 [Trichonephila clavipes]|uniref:Uncharacterized protein n=1 Tax=Trichonephila clavipes TaxID=2585209 RepID=A0A8X6RRC9_TRICX|nr:hypothetical protein TNCV_2839941 [Trichonephila clavipes]
MAADNVSLNCAFPETTIRYPRSPGDGCVQVSPGKKSSEDLVCGDNLPRHPLTRRAHLIAGVTNELNIGVFEVEEDQPLIRNIQFIVLSLTVRAINIMALNWKLARKYEVEQYGSALNRD